MDSFAKHTIIFDLPKMLENSSPWLEHGPFGFFLISILKPRILVELGVYTGYSYNAFCQAVKTLGTTTKCYGIDTWKVDDHAGFYEEDIYQNLLQYQLKEYPDFSHLLRMTFDRGLTHFQDNSIDLLHIDGLHTYEAVKHDFESWLPKMSDKGVIVFHDTEVRERNFGVWKLWEELSDKYPSVNFEHGYGLGIIAVGNTMDKEFTDFLREANANIFYKKLFLSLGRTSSLDAARTGKDSQKESRDQLIKYLETKLNEQNQSLKALEAKLDDIYSFAPIRLLLKILGLKKKIL